MDKEGIVVKRCLLISPLSFYGWHSVISKELENRGYTVELMNDEYPQGTIGLLLGNFVNKLVRKLTYKKFAQYLENKSTNYDLVLIFKGRGVSDKLINLLSKNSTKTIAYNFDSFKYFRYSLDWYTKVDQYKTFDFKDSEDYGIQRIDLFSDASYTGTVNKKIDISCVMKNHSERLVYLDEVYGILKDKCTFNIHIFEKNIFTYMKSLFQHPVLFYKWRKQISFKSLNSIEYLDALSSSRYTIDYAHPSQTGITMRCFQAAACGTKIISNNSFLANSESMKEGTFYVHSLGGNTESLHQFVDKNMTSKAQFHYRSAENFVAELLSE